MKLLFNTSTILVLLGVIILCFMYNNNNRDPQRHFKCNIEALSNSETDSAPEKDCKKVNGICIEKYTQGGLIIIPGIKINN